MLGFCEGSAVAKDGGVGGASGGSGFPDGSAVGGAAGSSGFPGGGIGGVGGRPSIGGGAGSGKAGGGGGPPDAGSAGSSGILSCSGLASHCGPAPANIESCCETRIVTGGSFYRSYDGVTYNDKGYPATVSDFGLDRFEVTVGRFRKFKGAWDTGWRPAVGAGKHTHLNGGNGLTDSSGTTTFEQGWDATWTANVTPTDASLLCSGPGGQASWTSLPGANENRPINCINWYEAYAFCIWDGAFLPSEAEWNYAASGGNEQRAYSWSIPATSTLIDCAHANYYASDYCSVPGQGSTNDVGAESPRGDGKYGHADLTGNVWEWTLDWYGSYTATCTDCAYRLASASIGVIRGGGLDSPASDALVSARFPSVAPLVKHNNLGFRCARTP